MKTIEKLVTFFRLSKSESQSQAPEGYCPNCWGIQEWDGKIRKMYEDKQIDVNNHEAHYAFIQEFVVNQIDGIRLKGAIHKCPNCLTNYGK